MKGEDSKMKGEDSKMKGEDSKMKGPNLKEGSECHTDIPYLVKDTPYPLVQLKEK